MTRDRHVVRRRVPLRVVPDEQRGRCAPGCARRASWPPPAPAGRRGSRAHRPSPPQRQSWNGQAIASPLTVPWLRSPPMCLQYASSTCSAPDESANTTSLVPNAATACGTVITEPAAEAQAVPAARKPGKQRARCLDGPNLIHTLKTRTCSSLGDMAASDTQAEGATQAVVAAVAELLPVFGQRAQETEDARVVPAESVKALRRDRVLPAAPADVVRRRWRRTRSRSSPRSG